MNTATSFRYQLFDYRYAFPIFYGIMIILTSLPASPRRL